MTALANFENRSGRVGSGPAALGDVVPVVEADAHDLARERDRGATELDRVEREPRRPLEHRGPAAEIVEGLGIEVDAGQEAVEDRDQAIADEDRRPAVLIAEVRDEPHRRAVSWPTGRRWPGPALSLGSGLAVTAGVALGAAGLGAAPPTWSGSRSATAHCFSGFVRSPHCPRRPGSWPGRTCRAGSTRPQTIAWNGVDIWSNRAITGPIAPFGMPQTGPGREGVVERAQLGLALGGRAGAVALVEDDQAAVLQVVDPALRDDVVVRAVDAGRDRAGDAGLVDVVARRRGAVGVGHLRRRRRRAGGPCPAGRSRARAWRRRRATRSGPGSRSSSRRRRPARPRRTRRARSGPRRPAPRRRRSPSGSAP